MLRWTVLLCAVFVVSILEVQPISGKRSFGGSHSYSKSGGLSGGGRHTYPSSGGLSGGGSHGYPSSGGLSGGGSHGYPPSGGLSGGGRSPGTQTYSSSSNNHGYPSSSNNHGYPSSSNNHGYPSSGLSGNNNNNKHPAGNTYTSHTTNVHNHYHYSPPQQIRYTPVSGGPPMTYPVYRGAPPTYVYQYKDSGSKYGTLLAGLALLNLGTLAGGAYALSHSNSHGSSSNYKAQPGEVCKFAIKKENGDYEETRIDCQLISSFIYQEQAKAQSPSNTNSTIITTTVTNVTVVNNTNVEPAPAAVEPGIAGRLYTMLPNGTLIPVNDTNVTTNSSIAPSPNNTMASSVIVTTTTTNTTVVNALDVKGKPVDVTPGMKCFVIRLSPTGNMRKTVPCGLLQSYADQSLKKSAAHRNVPLITLLTVVFTMCIVY